MRGPVQGKGSGVPRGGRSVGAGGGESLARGKGRRGGEWEVGTRGPVLGKELGEEESRMEGGVEAARAGGSVWWTREW